MAKKVRARPVSALVNRMVPIAAIAPHPDNYNQHPESQLRQLEASYEQLGQYNSIVVWARPGGQYIQVARHGFLLSAKNRGATEIRADILPEDTDPLLIKRIMAADNLHARNSEPDEAALARLLQEQADAGFDLTALGTDAETLRQMLESLGESYLGGGGEQEEGEADTLPDEVETRCKVGDIWQLGRHTVACMDALDPLTYTLLLHDTRPHAIITDPPYGMRLDTDYSAMKGGGDFVKHKHSTGGRSYSKVLGDSEDFDATLLMAMFPDVKEQFWFGADYYSATLPDTMHTGCWLVWDKRVDENLDAMFGSCFELIWSKKKHKRDIIRQKWAGLFGTEHEPQRGRQHPTQKPVRLLEDLITRYTDEGQVILDMFLGSGTTIISAERTGRTAYGSELSPEYMDVVIARWEKHTGHAAVLLERAGEVPNHA